MWDDGWEKLFRERDWGKYPSIDVVRTVSRLYGGSSRRSEVAILEIGCGNGANLWFVAREGYRAYGIDGSDSAIARLRARFETEGLPVTAEVGDALSLPWQDGFFDCVLDVECLDSNWRADSERIVDEVAWVLRPGGNSLSITFPTGTSGDGLGDELEGEDNTYLHLKDGAIRGDCGIVRFTAREEIEPIYARDLKVRRLELVTRTEKNEAQLIAEWIVLWEKPGSAD